MIYKNYILIGLVSLILGGIVGWYLHKPIPAVIFKTTTDTVYVQVTKPPLVVTGKGRVVWDTIMIEKTSYIAAKNCDSVLINEFNGFTIKTKQELTSNLYKYLFTRPFTSVLDTILKDTITLKYKFPSNIFNIEIRYKPDSIMSIRNIEYVDTQKWYEKPAYLVGGIITGMIIGRYIK